MTDSSPPNRSANSEYFDRYQLLLYAVVFEGGQILLAWLLAWLWEIPLWEQLRWDGWVMARGLALTAPLLVFFFLFHRWPIGPLREIKRFVDTVVVPMFAPLTMLDLTVVAVLAGVGEEMLFRGVLQPWCVTWLGPVLGITLTSLLFGLCHPITGTYVVLATVVGIYLGWAFHFSENLLEVIIAHTLYDLVALVVLLWCRPAKGDNLPASGGC